MPLTLSSSKKSTKPITRAASKGMHGPGSRNESMEEVDSSPSCSAYSPSPTLTFDLPALLERLHADPGYMALLSGKELELLAEGSRLVSASGTLLAEKSTKLLKTSQFKQRSGAQFSGGCRPGSFA